jgi:aminoglycoside 6'-N-acetyltransferase I
VIPGLATEPMDLTVELAQDSDATDWLAMRRALWPSAPPHEHRSEMRDLAGRSEFAAFIARNGARAPLGFAEVFVRPFANGCVGRPVPFLEGVWVAPEARGQGVGRVLLGAVEAWAQHRGFGELGSDALIGNESAHRTHAAWGFAETERVVYFRKPLAASETF